MADIDPQLETKKRARRRLVGACALFLVAVVVLPMVMDQEPRPLTEDIQIRIPNPDATAALSRPLPMKAAEKTEEVAKAPPEAVAVEIDSGSVKPAAEEKPSKRPAKPEENTAVKAEPKPEPKPEPEPKAENPAAGKTDKAARSDDQYVVQLGTFSDAENARKIKLKVKSIGVDCYLDPLKTEQGERLRVRAGPFPDKAAAEKAKTRLGEASLSGVVTVK